MLTAYRSVVRINERRVRFSPSPQTSRKAQNKNFMEEIKKLIENKFSDELEVQMVKSEISESTRLVVRPTGGAFYTTHINYLVALQGAFGFYYYIATNVLCEGVQFVIH
jgi:hypothetical protein